MRLTFNPEHLVCYCGISGVYQRYWYTWGYKVTDNIHCEYETGGISVYITEYLVVESKTAGILGEIIK